jgi:7-cyano-7-deazaguanine synthase
MTQKRAVAIVSGGLDSTTMVYHLTKEGYEVDCLSFDYGQRHKKELVFARATALQLGLRFDVVDLSGLTHLISNSALTSDNRFEAAKAAGMMVPDSYVEVPDGHYAEDTMKATVVPNRNMIMLSIAAGVAVNREANTVATGVHAGDHFIYPDCRPEFIFAAGQTMIWGNEGFHNFDIEFNGNDPKNAELVAAGYTSAALPIYAPFLYWTKASIAHRAIELGVPLHMTWSCYKGRENHCGRCGTCVERLEAIDSAIRQDIGNDTWTTDDLTVYDDTEFWKTAINKVKGESHVDTSHAAS